MNAVPAGSLDAVVEKIRYACSAFDYIRPITPPTTGSMEQQYISRPASVAATSEERTLAILAHVLTLIGGFLAPLIIWLLKKDESNFVSENAKESLNFQITLILAMIVCGILMLIIIGAFLMMLVGLLALVFIIVATIRASEGKVYRYPMNIRFIK